MTGPRPVSSCAVFDDAQRDRFVATVAGALTGVRGDVLERAFEYWRIIDEATGSASVRENRDEGGRPLRADAVLEEAGPAKTEDT